MAKTFAHSMPWGAELRSDGAVRFRLWAPGQAAISLSLGDGEAPALPMARNDDGWFELVTDEASVGSRYRFVLENGMRVPDPASRWQPDDVFGPSVVVDPRAYSWQQHDWRGRPWEEAIWYELHVGTFSPEGSFDGLRRRLDHLVDLGVTIVELMPLAEFPGRHGWGYDGVQLYAPEATYGTPEELKRLVDAAHERGLMIFLDVVFNHFGPEGNYLGAYASDFFNSEIHTPWGGAIDYARPAVRDYAIHNALYWLEEYRFDGLRLDAVDHIEDAGDEHLLTELARTVRDTVSPDRHVHLVVENGRNIAHLLDRNERGVPIFYNAQWNDDIHHCYHVLLTREAGGYYCEYVDHTISRLARALATGFVFQGEVWHYGGSKPRGEPSEHLPPTAFVGFIQNHDQIGNRAFGERMAAIASQEASHAMMAVHLLAPQIPLLFMGEEWGATQPFCFFTDFHDELADAVREGRRREFAKFPEFADEAARAEIPDPNALSTFDASRLDWSMREKQRDVFDYVKTLVRLRKEFVIPKLAHFGQRSGDFVTTGHGGLRVTWRTIDGDTLMLVANLDDRDSLPMEIPNGEMFFETAEGAYRAALAEGRLPAWTTIWLLGRS